MIVNSNEIQKVLPHRYPFLLVDIITDYEPGRWAKGIKAVSANEWYFCGHFPSEHVMPGALIIEALAQVGAYAILIKEENRNKNAYFGGIKNARFRKKVVPGDVLYLECEIIKQKGHIGIGKCIARVKEETVADAEIIFAVQ